MGGGSSGLEPPLQLLRNTLRCRGMKILLDDRMNCPRCLNLVQINGENGLLVGTLMKCRCSTGHDQHHRDEVGTDEVDVVAVAVEAVQLSEVDDQEQV